MSIAVALSIVLPPSAMARQHLVDGAEITARLQAAAAERATNQLKVERFLSSHIPPAAPDLDVQRLRAGVAALSDAELSDLARRADALQTDPVAGVGKTFLIVVGVVVLVVVVLAALIVKSCKEQGAECLD